MGHQLFGGAMTEPGEQLIEGSLFKQLTGDVVLSREIGSEALADLADRLVVHENSKMKVLGYRLKLRAELDHWPDHLMQSVTLGPGAASTEYPYGLCGYYSPCFPKFYLADVYHQDQEVSPQGLLWHWENEHADALITVRDLELQPISGITRILGV